MMTKILPFIKRTVTQYINPELCRPKVGRIIVTRNCPLRCQMCTFWHESRPDPTLRVIKRWIKELVDFGVKDISIGGGEPFIRKDLVEIVKDVKSYGVTCGVTTSGWLVGKVPFPSVDQCEISIDGATPETHDKIRGVKGSWERAINAIKIIQRNLKSIQLNFVLQADNYVELSDLCLLAKQLGVGVSIIPVSLKLAAQSSISKDFRNINISLLKRTIDAAIRTGNLLNNREFIKIALSKLEKGSTRQRCMAPFECILIFANGDVYPCGNFDSPVGNLSEGKRLEDIYQSYKALRMEVWSGSYESCGGCIYPDISTRTTLLLRTMSMVQRSLKRYML